MDQLHRKVLVVRRRLILQRFIAVLPWFLTATLLAATAFLAINKYYPLGLQEWAWPALAAALAVVSAAAFSCWRERSELAAAIDLDRRYDLRERVSSTYALTPTQRDSAMGQALVNDALRSIEQVDVGGGFRVAGDRWTLLPLAPAALAFLVIVFWHPANDPTVATAVTVDQKIQVKRASAVAQQQAAARREEAREKHLAELEAPLAKVEQGLKELAKGDDDRRQALVKINDLAKELEQRREQLRNSTQLKEQLDQMKDLARGPADKLADAMRRGDMQQAIKELAALKEQMQQGHMGDEAKAQLAKQFAELGDKLQEQAEKQQQRAQDLQEKMAAQRAAGQNDEAADLQKQLDRLAKSGPQMQRLADLAKQLGKARESEKDAEAMAGALAELQDELGEMQQQLEEADLLDATLSQMAEAKEAMACKDCNGDGCEACRGHGMQPIGGPPGRGIGRGHQEGVPPDEELATGHYDTKVNQKPGRGAVTVIGEVDGPNVKGRVEQEIQTQFEAVRGAAADPLADTKLPRAYRDHARKYFDSLREGTPASQ